MKYQKKENNHFKINIDLDKKNQVKFIKEIKRIGKQLEYNSSSDNLKYSIVVYGIKIPDMETGGWSNRCKDFKFVIFLDFDKREGLVQVHTSKIKQRGSAGIDDRFLKYMYNCGIRTEDIISGAYNHGQKSFVTLASVHAYLNFAKFCAEKNFKFFFVIIDFMNLLGILSVNANTHGDYFDYRRAAAMYEGLQDMRVNNKPKWYDMVEKIIGEGMK